MCLLVFGTCYIDRVGTPRGWNKPAQGQRSVTLGMGPHAPHTLKGLHKDLRPCCRSIPDVSLIELHSMLSQEYAEFILECHPLMVFFLTGNAVAHRLNIREAHGERSISILPLKSSESKAFGPDPLGRVASCLTDDLGQGDIS